MTGIGKNFSGTIQTWLLQQLLAFSLLLLDKSNFDKHEILNYIHWYFNFMIVSPKMRVKTKINVDFWIFRRAKRAANDVQIGRK